jgi:hypothetical protein
MHGPINVKSPNNISKWQMGFNSAFKGLNPHYARPYVITRVCVVAGDFVADSFFSHFIRSRRQFLALPIKEGKIHPREGHKGHWLRLFSSQTFSRINTPTF